ncbi:U3 small nucleolar RNA-associated protein 6 [Carex littledalei]|uniref:U3 small nucleolar RNA-associated protein 6 n=1 Tax=Carex littledalei TaxID=544730 RepID=A0A833VJH7_9POAL|nr:U3 small nucleolar RNA-associated protein 6 [Carex littledalei]
MADVVQLRLERMAEELEDLSKRGLFSRAELDSIVRNRREFEFRLKRPSPLKSDILAYIDYELNLDSLRQLRRRKILGQMKRNKKRNRKWKKSISDWAGVKRILGVFKMGTLRFKGDLELWFRYLEFCRERKDGRMKEALAQAIRYHPKVPGLWIYAAAWEFDHNLNAEAARALMQSGLRSCPKSEDLWIEYLRMELTYLNKLRVRKQTLGEIVPTGTDKWKDENKDSFMALNEERDGNSSQDAFWKKGLLMLRVIYRGAVEAVPESFELRKKFLEILDAANLGDTNQLKQEMMDNLRRDFSKEEGFWNWFARVQIGDVKDLEGLSRDDTVSKINKAVEVYEDAIKTLPTERMFSFYAQFWHDILHESGLDEIEIDFAPSLFKVYQKAELAECLTEKLACDYIKSHVQIGKLEEAREVAERLCSGTHFSVSGEIWGLRVSVELKWATCELTPIGKEKLESIICLIKCAAEKVPVSETEDLWLLALKIFANDKGYFEKLVKLAIFAVARSSGGGATVAQLEFNLAFVGNDKNALANVRKLYESALGFYSQDKELWREYYLMETKMGTSETTNAVYWRARKTLKTDLNST